MMLTHECPNCLRLHEDESTPEPSKLCPECQCMQNYIEEGETVKVRVNKRFCLKCEEEVRRELNELIEELGDFGRPLTLQDVRSVLKRRFYNDE